MSYVLNVFKKLINYFYFQPPNLEKCNFSERFYAGSNDEVQEDVKRSGIKGIVTYFDAHRVGRIDGYINFDHSSVITFQCKEEKIVVGSEVLIDITRNSKISPWYASKIEVLNTPEISVSEDWNETDIINPISTKRSENIENLPQKQVGMITYSYNDDLTLNNEINFRQRDCGKNSFRPLKGDWVVVQFDHSIGLYRVVGITPLRYLDFEGHISSFDGNYGYIDGEIKFSKHIITSNQHFTRGLSVFGTAIESVQGRRCNFRALTIFSRSKTNHSIRPPLRMRLKTMDRCEDAKNPKSLGLYFSTLSLDFGDQSIEDHATLEVTITNNNDSSVIISSTKLSSETNNQFVIDSSVNNYELLSRKCTRIFVKCVPQFPGLDNQKLFVTGIGHNGVPWKVLVDIVVYVSDPVAKNACVPKSPDKKLPLELPSDFIGGIYLSAAAPVKLRSVLTKMYPHKLKMYPVPIDLEAHVTNGDDIFSFYPLLKAALNPGTYARKMDLVVHLEEINAKEEMEKFVLENVRLISRRDTFGIEVPGLSEGRPSLMVGDKVSVKVNGSSFATYSGSIEDIMCDCIFVKFHAMLSACYTNEECTVTFTHSRLPFRRMHLGVEMACGSLGDGIIFPPSKIQKKSSQCVRLSRVGEHELSASNFTKLQSTNLLQLQFYNQSLNELQKVAVLRIVHGYCRPLPYVLFGPPGTGKTVTLVESILQVYKNVPSSRILVCAPSNSAADLLCLRLDESSVVQTGEMVRMNAYRRTILSERSDKEPIPPRVLPYCKSVDDLSEIAMHRLIICTCISSGALYRLGLKAGHISHVFVDEAGQASEPEIMVSLGLVSPDNGQIVLAGDPMQLGPVIRSPYAQALQESYLHRLLLSCEPYMRQKEPCPGSSTLFNPLVVTQLLNNYRAHPALLKLPSEMFYDGTLVPCASKDRFVSWKWLPNPEIPFIFHAVRGKEMRHQKNPSTYNPSEAVMVTRWIGRILQTWEGENKLEDAQISIITPYRAQVDCIRKLIKSSLEEVNLAKLKVASVEEFQGQENEVIIISTVRSSLEENVNGTAHESLSIVNTVSSRLGFLANKRRFNVSITRACSLLIVIGDPALLQYDESWSRLIKYAKNNKAYMGTDL